VTIAPVASVPLQCIWAEFADAGTANRENMSKNTMLREKNRFVYFIGAPPVCGHFAGCS